ncbi:MAG: T9SS type A sorting domain-containing protein, partial [Bacteroidota bacterium]
PNKPNRNGLEKVDQEIQIGVTEYDLQSNSANCNRISARPDGRIAGTWTQGFEGVASPNRGTGYNTRVDFAWGDIPSERIETVRTGWPNHVFTASGKEFVVAHNSDSELTVSRRDGPMSQWTQSFLPSMVPGGSLWPRAAAGGPDGESIHVIAITTPVANGGMAYEGVDGHVLYHRSLDGGETWDQVDIELDGLGSDFTVGTDADAYYIDARGETVAFAIFNSWDDLLMFKSTDNGNTWTKTIVWDFPLERYEINSGYAIEDLPPFDEENQPDSLAILTSDSYGTLTIDNDGGVHVFYGNMWVSDVDLADAGSTFFPATDGITYWNETLGTVPDIVGVIDQNSNDTLDVAGIADIASYFASISSMPSAGVDADNNLYLTYSSLIEGAVSIDDDMQHYRHVYVVASSDGGATWTDPLDLITPDVVSEPDLADFVEAVFPTMARDVDSKVRLIYQQDFRPGLSVRGDEDEPADNFINYIQLDVSELGVVQTEEQVDASTFALNLAPNVTTDRTLMSYTLSSDAQVSTSLVNVHGQLVKQLSTQNLAAGTYQEQIDLSTLPNGVYYVMLRADRQYTAIEVIKQ